MQIQRDTIFERMIKLSRGKQASAQNQKIHKRHMQSVKIPLNNYNWIMKEMDLMYHLQQNVKNHIPCRVIWCHVPVKYNARPIIFVYIHLCLCSDFQINNTICKHCHLVSRFLPENNINVEKVM